MIQIKTQRTENKKFVYNRFNLDIELEYLTYPGLTSPTLLIRVWLKNSTKMVQKFDESMA